MSTRTISGILAAITLLLAGSFAQTTDLAAQDIEVTARVKGIALPSAYYQRVQQDPTAYEFERAFFRRTTPARTSAFGEVRLPVILGLFSDSEEEPRYAHADDSFSYQQYSGQECCDLSLGRSEPSRRSAIRDRGGPVPGTLMLGVCSSNVASFRNLNMKLLCSY